jgi:HSP20 family protein
MALPIRRRETHQLPVQSPARTGTANGWISPWSELEQLHEQMGRMLQNAFTGLGGLGGFGRLASWSPPLDLEETDEAFVAEIELPGVNKDDVDVELAGDQVHVHGEIKQRERTGILRHQTRRLGTFDAVFSLPAEVDADKVSADLKDGVLTVHMPKAPEARPVRIKVPVN